MAIIEGSVRAGATFARSLSIRMPGYDLPPTGSFLMQFRRDKSSAPALVFSSADGSIQVTGWDSTSETVTLALLATSTQTAALAGTLHSNLIYQDGDSVDALDGNFLLRVDDGFSLSESPPAPSYGDISAWEPITDFTGADSATVLELMQRGARGPMPGHEWTGTALALQNIDGTWEAPVELKGEAAPNAWAPIVDFAAGISAQESQPTTVVRYQNETYIVAPGAGSFTTTGTLSPAQWVKIAAKGADIASTDALPEGSSNQYFTESRVRGTALTGLSTGSSADVTAADSVVSAIGKLQTRTADNAASVATKAPSASPTFTGTVAVPVPDVSDNSTRPAPTSWVLSKIASAGVSTVNGMAGAVTISKSEIGLANVDNTSDASKPISTATQAALDAKANNSAVSAALAAKVDASTVGAANGVAPLDATGKVPMTALDAGLTGNQVYKIPADGKYAALDGSKITNIPSGLRNSLRHTVLSGPSAAGAPSFLAATYASLVVTTQNISAGAPLIVSAAMGYALTGAIDNYGFLSTNLTWTVSASATSYLPVSVSAAGVITAETPQTLKPVYQRAGTPAVAAGQYTFNISEMQMYLGDGTTANKVPHVIVGLAVAGAAAVTSTVAYAYGGYYESGFSSGMPAVSTSVSKNHNIGVPQVRVRAQYKVLTAIAGYSVGDVFENASNAGSTIYFTICPTYSDLSVGISVAALSYVANKSTGAAVQITASASVGYQLVVERAF